MADFNIISLFSSKSGETFAGVKVGQSYPALFASSIGGRTPKANALACVIESLWEKQVKLFSKGGNILAVIGEEKACICDGASLTATTLHGVASLTATCAAIAFEMASKDTEFATLLQKAVAGGASSVPVTEEIVRACDYFYYSLAKGPLKNVPIAEVTVEEIQAAIRKEDYLPYSPSGFEAYLPEVVKEKKKTSRKKSLSSFEKEVREGKYLIPYTWDEKVKGMVPPLSSLDGYVFTPQVEKMIMGIHKKLMRILERLDMGLTGAEAIGDDNINILLLGSPGTGKSVMARAICATLGLPLGITVCSKNTDESAFEGVTKIVEGSPCFCPTDSLLIDEFGGVNLYEELNLLHPSISMGMLGQKVEAPYIIKKNGYETMTVHPLHVNIATMNVLEDRASLDPALSNRFAFKYQIDDPTKDTFIDILVKMTKADASLCEWVYNAYKAIETYLKSDVVGEDALCESLSLRTCAGCIRNIIDFEYDPKEALEHSFVGTVRIGGAELAKNVKKEVINMLPSYK